MMFWDITAMIVAGFLFAGLAMPVKMFYKKTPKWFIPMMAGLGMLSFQVLSEYTWYPTTKSNLPEGSVVVATVPKVSWFRPWSYIKPQVFQFVVLDTRDAVAVSDDVKKAMLYFFERRLPAQKLPILINCQSRTQAFIADDKPQDLTTLDWQKLEYTERTVSAVCK